jgi:hypothetical protein
VTSLAASNVVVNTTAQATAGAPFQPGDVCFATLPGQSAAINGIEAGLVLAPVAVDTIDAASRWALLLLLLTAGLATLRFGQRVH